MRSSTIAMKPKRSTAPCLATNMIRARRAGWQEVSNGVRQSGRRAAGGERRVVSGEAGQPEANDAVPEGNSVRRRARRTNQRI